MSRQYETQHTFYDKIYHIISFLELTEDFPRDSKSSLNQPR